MGGRGLAGVVRRRRGGRCVSGRRCGRRRWRVVLRGVGGWVMCTTSGVRGSPWRMWTIRGCIRAGIRWGVVGLGRVVCRLGRWGIVRHRRRVCRILWCRGMAARLAWGLVECACGLVVAGCAWRGVGLSSGFGCRFGLGLRFGVGHWLSSVWLQWSQLVSQLHVGAAHGWRHWHIRSSRGHASRGCMSRGTRCRGVGCR